MQFRTRLIAVLLCAPVISPAFARTESGGAAVNVEQPPPFKTAGKFSHMLQKYSGINFISNMVASASATAAASGYLHGRVKVKVKGYNLTDLLQGKVRSVDIRIGSGKAQGVPIGSLRLRTTTPFQLNAPWKKGPTGLATPVLVAMDGQLDEKLVTRALRSKAVTENLRFLKLDLPGLGEQRLQILHPEVDVDGERINVKADLITAGGAPETGVKLDISARPAIEKERYVMLKDIRVKSDVIENQTAFADFIDELLNPFIDVGRMDRPTHAFRITSFSVKDERVHFAGRLLLAPKPQPPSTSGIAKGAQ